MAKKLSLTAVALGLVFGGVLFVSSLRPADTAIVVDTTKPGKAVSPLLYGTQIPWTGHGQGTLNHKYGKLTVPVTYSTFVLDTTKDAKIGLIRFHGDNVYNFRDGIGPQDKRPGRYFSQFGKQVHANTYGTHEYLDFCKLTGAEAIIVAPYLDSLHHTETDKIADQLSANWVEYCNAPSPGLAYGTERGWQPTTYTNIPKGQPEWVPNKDYKTGDIVQSRSALFKAVSNHRSVTGTEPGGGGDYTPYWELMPADEIAVAGKSWHSGQKAPDGYFAWLREFFGRKEPWGVKYWEIGNEVWAWNGGYAWASPQNYASNAVKIIDKMKAIDPTVKCGLNFPGPDLVDNYKPYQQAVLGTPSSRSAAYQKSDFVSYHFSLGPDVPNTINPSAEYRALFDEVESFTEGVVDLMQDYPKPVFVTEMNTRYRTAMATDPSVVTHVHRLKSALAIASVLQHSAQAGITGINQIYYASTGMWYETSAFRMVFEDKKAGVPRKGVTPTYLVYKLFGNHAKGNVIATSQTNTEALEAQAYGGLKDGKIRLFVINKTNSDATAESITIQGMNPTGEAKVYTLAGPQKMESHNEDNQDNVKIVESTVQIPSSGWTHTFPAASLTVFEITPASANSSVSLTTTALPTTVTPGDIVTLTASARNISQSLIPEVQVTIPIPSGTDYLTGSASAGGEYQPFMRMVTWLASNLAPDEVREFICRVVVR